MSDITNPTSYFWLSFPELTTSQLYDLLRLRQEVFVVEQNCPYLDADGLDQQSLHLLAYAGTRQQLIGYLRCIQPGVKFEEAALGRLVTAEAVRGSGVARQMMQEAIELAARRYPQIGIRISAQLYLEKFYTDLGFQTVSEPYDEDGIPHIEMLYAH